MKSRVCELCSGEASLYCVSDSAFLCWNCDLKVHQANFLVARHVRLTVCSKCNEFDGNRRSGIEFKPFKSICISCCSVFEKSVSSSSSSSLSSDCVSTTGGDGGGGGGGDDEESCKSAEDRPKAIKFYDFFDRRRDIEDEENKKIYCSSGVTDDVDSCLPPVNISGDYSSEKKPENKPRSRRGGGGGGGGNHQVHRVKAEGILVNWCRKLGLRINGDGNGGGGGGGGGGKASVLPVALQAFGVCLERFTILPFRVALASSLWFSLKVCERGKSATCQNRVIRKVEEISGVPSKLIVLGEMKISRVLKLNRRSQDGENQEEGWAECVNEE